LLHAQKVVWEEKKDSLKHLPVLIITQRKNLLNNQRMDTHMDLLSRKKLALENRIWIGKKKKNEKLNCV
jgi:hypothetical protein